jgi:copper chaperone CopZ
MVAGMALMSGMMGAMPSAMTAGMMAVMGKQCIEVTVGSGVLLLVATVVVVLWGRYRFRRGETPTPIAWVGAQPEEGLRLFEAHVQGMYCAECSRRVTRVLERVAGVKTIQVDVSGGRAAVGCTEEFAGFDAVVAALEEVGYPVARG